VSARQTAVRHMENPDSSTSDHVNDRRFERGRRFLSEVRSELERVTWPSQEEVYATTIIVILTTLALGSSLWSTDLLLDRLTF
jgi:preprotein translocase subunit SecE